LSSGRVRSGARARRVGCLWLCLLLPTILLQDASPHRFTRAFDFALSLYHHGRLNQAEEAARAGFTAFRAVDAGWANRFLLLQAEITLWQGFYRNSLNLVAQFHPDAGTADDRIQALTIAGQDLAYIHEWRAAQSRLEEGVQLCARQDWPQCGSLLKSRGSLALMQGNTGQANAFTQQALLFARAHHDAYLESRALLNLGWIASTQSRFTDAQELDREAYQFAHANGFEDSELIARQNLLSDSFLHGDAEHSLPILDAEIQKAEELGDIRTEMPMLTGRADADFSEWQLPAAEADARHAIALIEQLQERGRLRYAQFILANALLAEQKTNEAEKIVDQVQSLQAKTDAPSDRELAYFRGRIANARGEYARAAEILLPLVKSTHDFAFSGALADSYSHSGKTAEAEAVYREAFARLEEQMQQASGFATQIRLKGAASMLITGATRLLVQQGRGEEALRIVDRYFNASHESKDRASFSDARAIARRANATILTYWLGHEATYLWIVTPHEVRTVELPNEHVLKPQIRAYSKAIQEAREQEPGIRQLGTQLWQTLVGPAAALIPRNSQVILIDDEELSHLNFETLLVPGPRTPHYWIEDATLRVAPSLTALNAAPPHGGKNNRMLLMGDALQASQDFAPLQLAAMEMGMVSRHFAAQDLTLLQQQAATPQAYEKSNPGQYAYLHFVAHGVPGSADPMDSAIVLTRGGAAEDAYKLYAREILAHPLHARLVTISACQGAGSRYFFGMGMVGLSWAFQQAGADNVIGALWEISDVSTPQLMDKLYANLQHGLAPPEALRQAKLSLLHGAARFQPAFYWAPFQMYSRQ
jgi:CHAT domain-containing protein